MRTILFALSLAVAAPVMTTTAAMADGHNCGQLRQTVLNRVPATLHNRPWAALSCAGVSELHILLITSQNNHRISQQVDAVFRREGLIR
jgi:uncharacterized membrane protein YeiH